MKTLNEQLTGTYTFTLDRVIQRLQAAVERVEQEGRQTTTRSGRPNHVRAAAAVVSEVQALVGNLNLWGLIDNAAMADRDWQTEPATTPEESTP